MKKCTKVFLISFFVTLPFAGLVRTTYLTQNRVVEIAPLYNTAIRMSEKQELKESTAILESHNHHKAVGGSR